MKEYLKSVSQKFARTDVASGREMIYRADFEVLLKNIFQADGKVTQINHDSTSDNGNKPDFVISKVGVPILYIEAKDIGVSLDKIEKSSQIARYFGYDNLVLTDYVEFRFYRNGIKYGEPISIAKLDKEGRKLTPIEENFSLLKKTLIDFASSHKEPVKNGAHLARIMGGKAQRIRDNVKEMLLANIDSYRDLLKMRDVVKEHLVSSLDNEAFADMYAQTLVYGLFAARYNDSTPDTFSRVEARDLVPKTNPFLRSFFDHIAGNSFPDRLRYIVDELCEVFVYTDIGKILHNFYGKEKDNKDPIIHFYEDFLREYDTKKKMEMGVFYTPRPVVQFIIHTVDGILKNDFGLSEGISDSIKIQVEKMEINQKGKEVKNIKEYHKVQILDIATGTGTFLNEVINYVHAGFVGQEGRWPTYVKNDLLPRLHGFELMMASYTIAHLKLGMTLHDSGAGKIDTRLGVYLTNTLEDPIDYSNQGTLFGIMDSIAEESKNASRIKSEYPIMCVIGNPPYSGESMNPDYTGNDVYKVEIGGKEKLKERNSKWINDDYVKFIRFAESLIEKNGEGVIGMITAHGYIDNPTFRGMRWHLRKTFDAIYIVDLHGNSRKKEVGLDGEKDENVFDIMSGVSIIFCVKKKEPNNKLATVHIVDLLGSRDKKFKILENETFNSLNWVTLPSDCDVWRVESAGRPQYNKGFSLNDIFIKKSVGIVTGRDSVVISQNIDLLKKNVSDYFNNDDFYFIEDRVTRINYRPFDTRYIYYDKEIIERGRWDVMRHLLKEDNIGLNVARQVKAGDKYRHAMVFSGIVESSYISNKTSEIGYAFPLYLYVEGGSKIPNLKKEIVVQLEIVVGKTSPENILDYIYAVLHSLSYCEKYKDFLKTDFPRVPYPKTKEQFFALVKIGEELRALHLLENLKTNHKMTTFSIEGSDMVEKITYEDSKVYINEKQYFGGVQKDIWEFYIGGYQPAQKWLKDRKGNILTSDDMSHYQKMIVALSETIRLMSEIDKINI